MTDENSKLTLAVTAILAIVLVSWSELHDNHRLPLPSRYIGIGLVWGTLGLTAPFITYPLAAALGAGMLVMLYYQHFSSSRTGGIVGNGLAPSGGDSGGSSGFGGQAGPPGVAPLQTAPLN